MPQRQCSRAISHRDEGGLRFSYGDASVLLAFESPVHYDFLGCPVNALLCQPL
jgi:hypothetical protein